MNFKNYFVCLLLLISNAVCMDSHQAQTTRHSFKLTLENSTGLAFHSILINSGSMFESSSTECSNIAAGDTVTTTIPYDIIDQKKHPCFVNITLKPNISYYQIGILLIPTEESFCIQTCEDTSIKIVLIKDNVFAIKRPFIISNQSSKSFQFSLSHELSIYQNITDPFLYKTIKPGEIFSFEIFLPLKLINLRKIEHCPLKIGALACIENPSIIGTLSFAYPIDGNHNQIFIKDKDFV